MNKIYEQAKDLHVRNYVVFGNTIDDKLYYEAEFTNQVTQADLEDAFVKGALLIDDAGVKFVPVSLNGNEVCTVDAEGSLVEWAALATPVE